MDKNESEELKKDCLELIFKLPDNEYEKSRTLRAKTRQLLRALKSLSGENLGEVVHEANRASNE